MVEEKFKLQVDLEVKQTSLKDVVRQVEKAIDEAVRKRTTRCLKNAPPGASTGTLMLLKVLKNFLN